jgi:acyl carrier protein
MKNQDENRLKELIAAILSVLPTEITEESNSDNIENWDSMSHMNLILALEEEYNISIPNEEASNITSYLLIKIVTQELIGAK